MDEELKKLLQENLAKNAEIYDIVRRLKTYLLMSQIMSVLRLVLVIVPIILAILYLPPFVNDLLKQYQGILGTTGKTLPL